MSLLTELAPGSRTVTVRGQPITITGIGVSGIAMLVSRFKNLGPTLLKTETITPEQIIALGPEVAHAVLAAGCGEPGSAKAEAAAATIGVAKQLEVLLAIIEETMPDGVDPFVQGLERVAELVASESLQTAAGKVASAATGSTSSPPPSTG